MALKEPSCGRSPRYVDVSYQPQPPKFKEIEDTVTALKAELILPTVLASEQSSENEGPSGTDSSAEPLETTTLLKTHAINVPDVYPSNKEGLLQALNGYSIPGTRASLISILDSAITETSAFNRKQRKHYAKLIDDLKRLKALMEQSEASRVSQAKAIGVKVELEGSMYYVRLTQAGRQYSRKAGCLGWAITVPKALASAGQRLYGMLDTFFTETHLLYSILVRWFAYDQWPCWVPLFLCFATTVADLVMNWATRLPSTIKFIDGCQAPHRQKKSTATSIVYSEHWKKRDERFVKAIKVIAVVSAICASLSTVRGLCTVLSVAYQAIMQSAQLVRSGGAGHTQKGEASRCLSFSLSAADLPIWLGGTFFSVGFAFGVVNFLTRLGNASAKAVKHYQLWRQKKFGTVPWYKWGAIVLGALSMIPLNHYGVMQSIIYSFRIFDLYPPVNPVTHQSPWDNAISGSAFFLAFASWLSQILSQSGSILTPKKESEVVLKKGFWGVSKEVLRETGRMVCPNLAGIGLRLGFVVILSVFDLIGNFVLSLNSSMGVFFSMFSALNPAAVLGVTFGLSLFFAVLSSVFYYFFNLQDFKNFDRQSVLSNLLSRFANHYQRSEDYTGQSVAAALEHKLGSHNAPDEAAVSDQVSACASSAALFQPAQTAEMPKDFYVGSNSGCSLA
ncbi:MAG: hypothetical protein COV52_07360 [Gammaproteobacteria bacterium CG11_big_fil_rev_8_21_14_0_20_46_22]|nr:MAG: hypothetical protein COW05_00375 [Gammaproteobacteria bacterium CG12_big_fil_rev_8_21_14_0_65_46_12]PIR10849.1 MAG: hypothetical protein COV52_07360 [Gammaproteobacteria bacterium CG11_big_fil_rev_8_21_14_0_20_46_22]